MITDLGHIAFTTGDLNEAIEFYCDLLGLEEAFRLKDDQGKLMLVYLKVGEDSFIELFPGRGEKTEGEKSEFGFRHFCLLVDDMEATVTKLRKNGVELERDPSRGKDGNLQCWVRDPDGNDVELMEINPNSPQARA